VRSRWMAAVLLCALAAPASAQLPEAKRRVLEARQRRDTSAAAVQGAARDSSARRRAADSAAARSGLPTGPSRSFQTPDSVETELMGLQDFRITRYAADSVQFLPPEKQIRMAGQALVEREGSTLQADTIRYAQEHCVLNARGSPQLFDQTGALVGHAMVYDACNHAGLIGRAFTSQKEGSATWYIHGDMAVDNQENRVYAAHSTITTSPLPDPDYHFATGQVKWISRTLMVARPAVLYVADVPILWLPFIFQDMRHNRRSGLIPPMFGLSDIVRNSPSYHRHVSNFGYYWAINDYADAQVTLDWYSQAYLNLEGRVRYRWLDRFMTGGINFQQMHQFNGATSDRLTWSHQQAFSLESHLNAYIDYATSSSVISRNAVDPTLALATIDSRVNYQQTFPWGTLTLGGTRTQSLNTPQVSMTLPQLSFTPNPISLSRSVTWSPSFSVTNTVLQQSGTGTLVYHGLGDSSRVLLDSRTTGLSLGTPIRFGSWTWSNTLTVNDQYSNQRRTVTLPDPADTAGRVTRTYDQTFETDVDWSTGIGLPLLLQGRWNLQPSVGVVNTTSGPFMLRNAFTGGAFVTQGKRLAFSLSISPTFYGLFPGFGPFARIRHSVSPSVSWTYAPSAAIPDAYARALAASQGSAIVRTRSLATQAISIGLSQTFEAKLKPPRPTAADSARADSTRADTTGAAPPQGQKIKLLSIQTSAVAFDIEQGKQRGYTGWTTAALTNTFSTDLLRGFSLTTTHSLFAGPPDTVTSSFHPYLTSLSMRFGVGPSFLHWIGAFLGLSPRPAEPTAAQAARDSLNAARDTSGSAYAALPGDAFERGPLSDRPTTLAQLAPREGGSGFSASLAFDLSRQRPVSVTTTTAIGSAGAPIANPTHSTLSGTVSFKPTAHWSVSWQTLYDFQARRFGSHVLRLDRDLHDWRATFSFVQAPNGNVVFNFNITLTPQPEIKFDYDQRNLPTQ
jgi:hypothetical protein